MNHKIFRILQIAAFSTFIGRAWQHLFFDAPYRTHFWDEERFSPFVEAFGVSWQEWVTMPIYSEWIATSIFVLGVFYTIAAFSVLFINQAPKLVRPIISIGSVLLLFLAFSYYKAQFFFLPQFFEYALQVCSPIFLLWYHKNKQWTTRQILWIKIAIALTFSCHALYALNAYPRPGLFLSMTMNTLGFNEEQSITYLNIAGILDLLISFMLFFPQKKIIRIALLYAFAWGILTALARPVAFFYPEFWEKSLHQWVYQCVYRLPHGLIPLALWMHYKEE